MKSQSTFISDVFLIQPAGFLDDGSYFFESYQKAKYFNDIKVAYFVQANISSSVPDTIRGLHN